MQEKGMILAHNKQSAAWPGILLIAAVGTALFSCVSPFKQASLDSRQLVFSIRWTLSAKEGRSSFSSRLFIKGDEALRLDLLQNFVGSVARITLKGQKLILQAPFQKTYYKGEIQEVGILPGLPLLPSEGFSAVFRGRAIKGWSCRPQNTRPLLCEKNSFVIRWRWENSLLKSIRFEKQDERLDLQAEVRDISSKPLPVRAFNPHLKGWRRESDPLFFTRFYKIGP